MSENGDFFKDAISQYIDDNGKARMITYKVASGKLSLMISPIAPLDLPNEKKIYEVSIKTAKAFIKNKNLQITLQHATLGETSEATEENGNIKGVWIESKEEGGIYNGYIPLQKTPSLENVEFSEPSKLDPLRIEKESELSLFRKTRKIAEFLKKYTLYTYANHSDDFDESWFVVDKNHEYDLEKLNKKLFEKGNDVMYDSKGYLIVPDKETASKLMSYLEIQLKTDKPGVLNLSDVFTIEDYYQTVSDFQPFENQLIFTSVNGALRWKRETERVDGRLTVSQNLMPKTTEPYFYKTPKISNGRLNIIQNVEGGKLEDAIAVSYKWLKDKVNTGYFPPDKIALPENIPYKSYTNSGVVSKTGNGKKNEYASVIFYENGSYGAILFLE